MNIHLFPRYSICAVHWQISACNELKRNIQIKAMLHGIKTKYVLLYVLCEMLGVITVLHRSIKLRVLIEELATAIMSAQVQNSVTIFIPLPFIIQNSL